MQTHTTTTTVTAHLTRRLMHTTVRRLPLALALAALLTLPQALPQAIPQLLSYTSAGSPSTRTISSASHAQAHAAVLASATVSSTMLLAAGSPLHYRRGYSLESGWLCYGWASGAYRCTQHWYRAASGALISTNPTWVPNGAGVRLAVASVKRVVKRTVTRVVKTAAKAAAYHVALAAKPANTYPWGQCTWGAMALAHDNVNGLGNARDWLWRAQARGLPTGSMPRVGATVVYQPGVQGASWLGHVAHVVSVLSGGRFVVEEMNYQGYGGGFGRFSYRTSWVGAGVGFIY